MGVEGLIGLNGIQGMPVKVLYLNCDVLGSAKVAQLQSMLASGSYDIVLVVEVGQYRWDIPGYVRYGSEYTGPRAGGGRGTGVLAYVKSTLSTYVKKTKHSDRSIWLLLSHACLRSDYYLGGVYMNPYSSASGSARRYQSWFQELQEEVMSFASKCSVCMFGDFNAAHTGQLADFTDVSDLINELQLEGVMSDVVSPPRRNQDTTPKLTPPPPPISLGNFSSF